MTALNSSSLSAYSAILELKGHLAKHIIGQTVLVDRLLIALLADGHLLVEGAPGLAKTRAIKVLSEGLEASFHRIQFTPDLLPADLTGTEVYRPADGSFHFKHGPLFHHLILADEINRAPAKVQSALLEAMAERQITIGQKTYPLPEVFMVMATQNPIEHEGTYPLPEAQLDRFLMHIKVTYPEAEEERQILALARTEAWDQASNVPVLPARRISQHDIVTARREVLDIYIADQVEEYILQLVLATRRPQAYDATLGKWIEFGASPRATIALDRCARAHAWLAGRDYVTPEDIQAMAFEVLRHRLVLSYEGETEAMTTDNVIERLISYVAVP